VRPEGLQIVPHQRALPQVQGVRLHFEVFHQPRQGSRAEQHVRIHAQDELRIGFAEEQVAHPVAVSPLVGHVAIPGNLPLEVLQRLGAGAAGVVVQDEDFGAVSHLGMVETDGLHREVHAIVVVVGGHADAEAPPRPPGHRHRDGGPVADQPPIQEGGGAPVEGGRWIDLPQDLQQGVLGQHPITGRTAGAAARGQLDPSLDSRLPVRAMSPRHSRQQ
jgi:hypothetical protein